MNEKLNIEQVIKARDAIAKLLSFTGIDRKRVYWLSKNKMKLEARMKEWFTIILPEIYARYAIDIPVSPFVPVTKYEEFKKELIELTGKEGSGWDNFMEGLNQIFTKYEVTSDNKRGIPNEKGEEYQKEIQSVVEASAREIEIQEIITDRVLDNILPKLTGDEISSIEFMLQEPSPIEIFPQGLIQ
jgi:hypothetical protein